MSEPLTLKHIASREYNKADGSKGTIFTAFFKEGRQAGFFSKSLADILAAKENVQLGYEFEAPSDPKYDPTIKKVVQSDGTVLWDAGKSGGGRGGGGRPLLSDEQIREITSAMREGFLAVAKAIAGNTSIHDRVTRETEEAPEKASEPEGDDPYQGQGQCAKEYKDRRCILVAGHWSDHKWEEAATG